MSASSVYFFTSSWRFALSHSTSSSQSSTLDSSARSQWSALSGESIRPAALMRGPSPNPITSASHSISLSRLTIYFRSALDSLFFICLSPSAVIILFSQMRGIQSATVPREARSMYRVRIFSISSPEPPFFCFSFSMAITSACKSLNATPAPARFGNG